MLSSDTLELELLQDAECKTSPLLVFWLSDHNRSVYAQCITLFHSYRKQVGGPLIQDCALLTTLRIIQVHTTGQTVADTSPTAFNVARWSRFQVLYSS